MGEGKGQPLLIWSAVLLSWVAVRTGVILDGSARPIANIVTITPQKARPAFAMEKERGAKNHLGAFTKQHRVAQLILPQARYFTKGNNAPVIRGTPQIASLFPATASSPITDMAPDSLPVPLTSRTGGQILSGPESFQNPSGTKERKLQIYAYSFWRLDTERAQDIWAASGQYGGSQSGLVATYQLGKTSQWSLFGRMAATPSRKGDRGDREAAAGLRWRPAANIPVTLSAEYRFRGHSADAVSFYAAGSAENKKLPAGLRLGGYGQFGYVQAFDGGKEDSAAFFDASLRMDRPVFTGQTWNAAIGAGAWAGGQYGRQHGGPRGEQRLDIGPSIRFDGEMTGLPLHIDADWRFRVGGDARPGNGPTLTLSTGF
ncbi:MAG: hypothetical protein HC843_08215 [Sphingomonadales bacterium]|nr:hypothetical protein [Sphingomonadales bacterium]